jgi:GNAT superfamily N-acetyltransferase
MDDLIIRKAELSDVQAIINCVEAGYNKYTVHIGKKPVPMLNDYPLSVMGGHVYVGECAGEIVGILVIKDYDNYVLLDNIAVYPAWQGRSFGKRLIAFAENYAAKKRRDTPLYQY